MAETRTQDNQKVFNSATANLESFLNGVKNVSSSKNVELIYENMERLFQTFTQGVLDEQGENSTWLFRTVYRALDEDFLKILQDSSIVDKISDAMKEKQQNIQPEDVDTAQVSETTKKVISKTLDPIDYDPNEVTLDFLDELQSTILKIRLDLVREYEKQKFIQSKSYDGQQKDIEVLHGEVSEQNKKLVELDDEIDESDTEWTQEKIDQTKKILDLFNQVSPFENERKKISEVDKLVSNAIDSKKETRYKPIKIIHDIKSINTKNKEVINTKNIVNNISNVVETRIVTNIKNAKNVDFISNNVGGLTVVHQSKQRDKLFDIKSVQKTNTKTIPTNIRQIKFTPIKNGNGQNVREDKLIDVIVEKSKKLGSALNKGFTEIISLLNKEHRTKQKIDRQKVQSKIVRLSLNKKIYSTKQQVKNIKSPVSQVKNVLSQNTSLSKLKTNFNQIKQYGQKKISKSPIKKANIENIKKNNTSSFIKNKEDGDNSKNNNSQITISGIIGVVDKIHENIKYMLSDEKFKQQYMLNYANIQKPIFAQMKKIGDREEEVSTILGKTQKRIEELKKNKNKKSILDLILNPMNWIKFVFIGVGSLILISLIRYAFAKWKEGYVPKTSGPGISIFGIKIPFLDEIKNYGIGIYNFLMVNVPRFWRKIKSIFGTFRHKLFGKKGIFSSQNELWSSLKKIAIAFGIGMGKKAVGWLSNLLMMIPGWGIVASILIKALPILFSFIANQLQMLISNHQVDMQTKFDDLKKNYSVHQVENLMIKASQNVHPLVPPTAIPALQTPRVERRKGFGRTAILRRVNIASSKGSYEDKKKLNKMKMDKEIEKTNEVREKKYGANRTGLGAVNGIKFTMKDGLILSYNTRVERASTRQMRLILAATGSETTKLMRNTALKYIDSQMTNINKYREYLIQKKRTRFPEKSKLPLYDPVTGWNPEYTVKKSDLYTAIPLVPFEDVHEKPDIQFGSPSAGDDKYVGIMPFTWFQDGILVHVDPIQFEIERAGKIFDIWKGLSTSLIESDKFTHDKAERNVLDDIKKQDQVWRLLNNAMCESAGHVKGYSNLANYHDTFDKFFSAIDKGNIKEKDNNMENIVKHNISGEKFKQEKIQGTKIQTKVSDIAKTMFSDNSLSVERKFENGEEVSYSERLKRGEKALKAVFNITYNGMKYGDLRKVMLENIVDVFKERTIMSPIKKANSIIKAIATGLNSNSISLVKQAGTKAIYSLIWEFLNKNHIAGSSWDNIKSDRNAMAGFAQSFLEYIGYNIMPQWNTVQQLMREYILNEKNYPGVNKNVFKLLQMFHPNNIYKFLAEHIRFRNIQVRVVDETNATKEELKKIEGYKQKLGIISKQNMGKFIKSVSGDTNELAELEKQMKILRSQIDKVKFEMQFTGRGNERLQLLRDKMQFLTEKYARLKSNMKDGNDIVKNPAKITKVVEPPPKSQDEIRKEEEKKAAEEAERKRKEEEEFKKKKEIEEKRREALAIAKAKIAAMEAIKKQEQNYETILEKMIASPEAVTDNELKTLGDEVEKLKQEAENRINNLPRDKRDLKLALIRGDKISPKTFSELKKTAIELNGSLQEYITEVNKIPCGSIFAVQNTSAQKANVSSLIDGDEIDMGDY